MYLVKNIQEVKSRGTLKRLDHNFAFYLKALGSFWDTSKNKLLSCHTHHVFYKKEPDSDVVNEAHHLNSLGDGSYKVPGFASFDLCPFRCVC